MTKRKLYKNLQKVQKRVRSGAKRPNWTRRMENKENFKNWGVFSLAKHRSRPNIQENKAKCSKVNKNELKQELYLTKTAETFKKTRKGVKWALGKIWALNSSWSEFTWVK